MGGSFSQSGCHILVGMSGTDPLAAGASRHRGLGEGSARDQFWLTSGDGAVRLLEQSRITREPLGRRPRGLRRKPKLTGEHGWLLPLPGNPDVGLVITAARSIAPASRVRGVLVVDEPDVSRAATFSNTVDGVVMITRDGVTEELASVVAAGVMLRRTRV